MRRPFGHLGLILGSASLLFGCPGGDDSSGEGTTGGPTTDPTASTTMSTTTPATDSMSTSTTEPETGSESESGSTGSTGGSSESSGSGGSSGSGSGGGAGDFVINFTGYAPHDGQDIFLKVFSEDDATELGELTAVAEDSFTMTIPGIIEDGVNYNVRWWVDLNDSGACEPPGTDHAWELEGQAGGADGLTIDHAHDTDWTDVCSFWK